MMPCKERADGYVGPLLFYSHFHLAFASLKMKVMNRSHFALAALLLACAALAAPAPQPKPFVTGWESPVDRDRDCKIRHDKGTLIIEIPGGDHDYNPLRGQFNAPRLFRGREIEGKFVMQVRVRIDCRPSEQSTVEGQPSYTSAGFLVVLPDNSPVACIRLEFGVSRKGNGVERYVDLRQWDHKNKGGGWILERGWKGDAYLRLEQQREGLGYSISSDGENWKGLAITGGIHEKLKVGLAAYSTSTEPSKIRFDQFKLTEVRKKK